MASLAVMPPAVNKSPAVLPPSVLPKKRAPIAGGLTRSRFAKARPNVGALANKGVKEASAPAKEKVAAPHEESGKIKEASSDTPIAEPIDEKTPDLCEKVAEVSPPSVLSEESPEKKPSLTDLIPLSESVAIPLPDEVQKSPSDDTASEVPSSGAPLASEIVLLRVDSPLPDSSPSVAVTPPHVESLVVTPASVSTTLVSLIPDISPNRDTNQPTPIPVAPRTPVKHDYPTLKGVLNSPRKRIVTKKNHERRKRFANGAEPPPRSQMTIADLIYFNPVGTAVTVKKQKTDTAIVLPIEEPTEPEAEKADEEPVHSGPKVTINEKGEIVLDEASLLVTRKSTVDYSQPTLIDDEETTYASYRFKASKQWTTKETTKFYKALKLVGTDFALMEKIFEVEGKVTRTRKELKCKYKREERVNTKLVHQAIYDTQTFEISILENESDEDPDDPVEKKKKTRGSKKKKDKDVVCLESVSPSDQDEQSENASELAIVPSEVNVRTDGMEEISVTIQGDLYHSLETTDDSESPAEILGIAESSAEFIANTELPTTELENDIESVVVTAKKRGRKKKVKPLEETSESSSWEDASEIYHIPDVATKNQESTVLASVDEAQQVYDFPLEMVSDKNVLNMVELPEHRTTDDNLCMTAAISEVVTSKLCRRRKQNALPNVARKKPLKRPLVVPEETKTVPMPSFSSFTPTADEGEDDDVILVGDSSSCIATTEHCLIVKKEKECTADSDQTVSNVVELPDHQTTDDNLCTDAAITEVVTSKPGRGRPKRKALPNLAGSRPCKRPLVVSEETETVPMTSFSSFTPTAEEVVEAQVEDIQCIEVEIYEEITECTMETDQTVSNMVELPEHRTTGGSPCSDTAILEVGQDGGLDSDKTVSNVVELPENQTMDAAISEEVVTSKSIKRRPKLKALPNLTGRKPLKRPLVIPEETKTVPMPSFSSFTPAAVEAGEVEDTECIVVEIHKDKSDLIKSDKAVSNVVELPKHQTTDDNLCTVVEIHEAIDADKTTVSKVVEPPEHRTTDGNLSKEATISEVVTSSLSRRRPKQKALPNLTGSRPCKRPLVISEETKTAAVEAREVEDNQCSVVEMHVETSECTVDSDKTTVLNVVEPPEHPTTDGNPCTDAAISEVGTSKLNRRRPKLKALPNLAGSRPCKPPLVILEETKTVPIQSSSSFTPAAVEVGEVEDTECIVVNIHKEMDSNKKTMDLDKTTVSNVMEPPGPRTTDDNPCTDAAISEIVTSKLNRRRPKLKALPNLAGSRPCKPPLVILEDTKTAPIQSSSSFTPAVEKEGEVKGNQCTVVKIKEEKLECPKDSNKTVSDVLEIPQQQTTDGNPCTDAPISEVVTSKPNRRRPKLKALPNLTGKRAPKRPLVIPEENKTVTVKIKEEKSDCTLDSSSNVQVSNESQSVTQNQVISELSTAHGTVMGQRTHIMMSPSHTPSVMQLANGLDAATGQEQIVLTAAPEDDNVVHVFYVKPNESHQQS